MFCSCVNSVAILLVSIMHERTRSLPSSVTGLKGETASLGLVPRLWLHRPSERLKFTPKPPEPVGGSFLKSSL